MKKLLIATTNPGKLGEITKYLSDLPIALVGLKDVGITDQVAETGKTFEENAILKAKFYSQKSGLPTIADDGGLEIDALNGEPGVKSHRWIDHDRENEDEELIAYALERMKRLSASQRGAQLRAVVALALPDGNIFTAEKKIRGVIAEKPSEHRTKGFPFRALLFLPEIGKFYDHTELTEDENEQYNHRKRALEELAPVIKKYLC